MPVENDQLWFDYPVTDFIIYNDMNRRSSGRSGFFPISPSNVYSEKIDILYPWRKAEYLFLLHNLKRWAVKIKGFFMALFVYDSVPWPGDTFGHQHNSNKMRMSFCRNAFSLSVCVAVRLSSFVFWLNSPGQSADSVVSETLQAFTGQGFWIMH